MAPRTATAPTERTGSGGNPPGRRPTRPHPDHSSSRPRASDARMRPPTKEGPTPFPEYPTPKNTSGCPPSDPKKGSPFRDRSIGPVQLDVMGTSESMG